MVYDTTKPYTQELLRLVKRTWETPFVSVRGGLVRRKFSLPEYHHSDGIGTKGVFHWKMRSFRAAVVDALAMNLNDLAMMGARPYALVDHLLLPSDDGRAIVELVRALSDECVKRGIAITGGETAIHNNLEGLEISMTVMGFVERWLPNRFHPGDVLVGLPSSGLHSNGFTLVREKFSELREEFVVPTRIYELREAFFLPLSGRMHITGGAFTKLKGLLRGADAHLTGLFPPQEIFHELHARGIPDEEMYRTFNCGTGFVLGIERGREGELLELLGEGRVVGEVRKGSGRVFIESAFSGKQIVL